MLKRLTNKQKLIFRTFIEIVNEKQYPSLELISRRSDSNTSRINIFYHIQSLVKKGYIIKIEEEITKPEFARRVDYRATQEGIHQYIRDSKK